MAIYGEYGRIVDQAAVEDKFNDWASRKLFLIADEVVARMELYHTKNKLKSLITGEWIRINPKNIGAYDERNHVNLVFLSNETQPLVLERDDRRYTVIWTPAKLTRDFYQEVLDEIRAGGIAALHDYLLNIPLGDFGTGTEPPMTKAKADLIELGKDSTERFWDEWIAGNLPVPATAAKRTTLQRLSAITAVAKACRNRRNPNTFLGNIAKRPGAVKCRKRFYEDLTSSHRRAGHGHLSARRRPGHADPRADRVRRQFAGSLGAWRDGRTYLRAAA